MDEDFLPMDTAELRDATGNIYKTVSVIGGRANQHTVDLKEELSRKLAEFAPAHDNLEEVTENREQIEISKFYERKIKPHQESVHEFMDGKIYWRNKENPEDSSHPELS